MKLPDLQKLNLKCSAWIMSKVSVSRRQIILSDSKVLKFFAEDVYKVFGIPCGHRNVKGRDANINPEAINFIKATLQMNKSGAHSLTAAEEFLLRDINEDSSKLEKDCFQIAFVIFIMGHVLAPTTKHNYSTIDFWGAIANTEMIQQFNWCEYVLQYLLDAVRKLKKDMMSNSPSTNLTGCHLFFQVFLLDNLDLGMFNKPHDSLPRIVVFDQDTLRRMLNMAMDLGKGVPSYAHTPLRDPSTVCYGRAKLQHSSNTPAVHNRLPRGSSSSKQAKKTNTPAQVCQQTGIQRSTGCPQAEVPELGPLDFANYIRQQYPNLVADEFTMILKQQNARAIRQLSQTKNAMQLDMFKFADQLFKTLQGRCVCCRARGFPDCPALGAGTPNPAVVKTPAVQKIQGHRLNLSDCGGASPAEHVSSSRKRHSANEESSSSRKAAPSRCNLVNFFKGLLTSIGQMYADLPANSSATIFGQAQDVLPKRKYIFQHGYATDPWCRGAVPYPPHAETTDLIVDHFTKASEQDLQRYYIVHATPRLIRITGMALRNQLIGSRKLEHELVSMIFRRYAQADHEANSQCPYLSWRHFMEADFATIVLADHDYLNIISIQYQLFGKDIPYDITSCQMFFLPVPLEEGWLLLMWDMMSRKLHVLDPMTRGRSNYPNKGQA